MKENNQSSPKKGFTAVRILLLCLIGIVINMVGVRVTSDFELPLYMDTVGTMLTAVAAGSLPGIIVGFVTNILKGFVGTEGMYYGILNMFTALLSSSGSVNQISPCASYTR